MIVVFLLLKMQLCGTAFISQLAIELSLQADKQKSKIIGDDIVFRSLDALGFSTLKEEVKQVGGISRLGTYL